MARKNTETERLIRELGALKLIVSTSSNATLSKAADRNSDKPARDGIVSSLLPSSYFGQSSKNDSDKTSAKPTAIDARDAVKRCHAISQLLSSYQFRVAIISDRQNNAILTSAVEILLQCCHAESADVRIAAEEALSRLILCYGKTHTVSLLIEFFKEIRTNGPPRSLKTALKCFELLCGFVNPQKMKCRTLLFHLSQTAVKISRRGEESVQEAIGTALPRAFSVLGQFASEQETKAVLKTFFTLLGDENGVKRRASGLCMVSVCYSCRTATDMAEWLIRGLINMLTPNKTQVSFTLVLGTLTCIRYWLLALPHLLNENASAARSSFVTSARRGATRGNVSMGNSAGAGTEASRQRLENAFLTVTFLLLVYLRHDHFNVVTHCLEALTACVAVDAMRSDFERVFARPGAMFGIGLPLLMPDTSIDKPYGDAGEQYESKPGSVASGVVGNSRNSLDIDEQSLTSLNVVDQSFGPVIKNNAAGLQQFVGGDAGDMTSAADNSDKIADLSDFETSGFHNERYSNVDESIDRVSISAGSEDVEGDVEEESEAVIWDRHETDSVDNELSGGHDPAASADQTDADVKNNVATKTPSFDIKAEHDRLFELFSVGVETSGSKPSALTCLADILLDSFLYSVEAASVADSAKASVSGQPQHPAGKKSSVRHLSLSLLCKVLQQLQQFCVVNDSGDSIVSSQKSEIEIYSVFLKRAAAVVTLIIPVPPPSPSPTAETSAESESDPLLVGYSCQCLAGIVAGRLAVEQMRCLSNNRQHESINADDARNFSDETRAFYDAVLLTIVHQCLTNRSSITCRYALQALCRLLQCSVVHSALVCRASVVLNRLMPLLITPITTSKRDASDGAAGDVVMPGATGYWLCRMEWLKGLTLLPLALFNANELSSSSVSLNDEDSCVLPDDEELTAPESFLAHSANSKTSTNSIIDFVRRFDEIVDEAMMQCRTRSENYAAEEQPATPAGDIVADAECTAVEQPIKSGKSSAIVESKFVANINRRPSLIDLAIDSCLASLSSDDVRVRDAAACALNPLIITSSLKYVSADDACNIAQWKCSVDRAEPFTSLHSGHLFPYPICTSLYADIPPFVVSAALARCVHILKAHAYESGGLDNMRRLDGTFAALAALCQEYSPLTHTEAWFGFSIATATANSTAASPKQQKKAALAAVIGQKQLLTLGAKEANDLLRYCLHLLNQTRECADIRLHRNVLLFASHYMVALFLRLLAVSTSSVSAATSAATTTVASNKLSAAENSDLADDDDTDGTTYHKQLERKLDAELVDQIQLLKSTVKRMFHHLLCLEYMLESVIGGYQHFSAAVLKRNEALRRSLAETVRHVAVMGTSKLVESGAAIIGGDAESSSSSVRKIINPNISGKSANISQATSSPAGVMQSLSNMFSRTRTASSTSSGGGGKSNISGNTGKITPALSAASGGSGDATTTTQISTTTNSAVWKPTEAVFEKLYESLRKAYTRYLANAGDALLPSTSAATGTTTSTLLSILSSDSSGRSRGGASSNAASHKFQQFVGSTLCCLRLITEIIDKEAIVNNLQTIVKSVTTLMLIEPELCIDYSSSLLRKLFGLTAVCSNRVGVDTWLISMMDNRSYNFADTRHQCDIHPLNAAAAVGDGSSAASLVRIGFLKREQERLLSDKNNFSHGDYAAAGSSRDAVLLSIIRAADEGDIRGDFTFYTLCDKVQVLSQLNSRWKEDLDMLFRHPSKQSSSNATAVSSDRVKRQELSNQIRTFESIVIRAMQLYTCTGDANAQVKVLSFISLLLKLRVNYSVLDGEHILLEFVVKQIEAADGAGHIQRFERLVPAIFHFLLLLSREQHHVANTSVNMSKVIQLLDVLMAAELPNVTSDLICQIVFLFYKETVRRLLHARATLGNNNTTTNNSQHWQQIAEQLETEKEYLQSIILRLVTTHTSLYVLAFMLESMKNGDLSVKPPTNQTNMDLSLSTNNNSNSNSNSSASSSLSAYRSTAGLVFELAMSRLLRGDIDLGNSVASFCSLDYFFHILPNELFQPPDSLLCQVYSLSSCAMLTATHPAVATNTTTSVANRRRPSVIASSSHYAAAKWNFRRSDDASGSAESSLLALQMLRFFIAKTLFERNTALDMRNGIADWWHTARGIIALDSAADAINASGDDLAFSSFIKLFIFDDGLRQSACGAVRLLCLGSSVSETAGSSGSGRQLPPLSTCYLRLFVAQCSLIRYLATKSLQHSKMLCDALQFDGEWFGGFFVHLCGALLSSVCAPSPVPVLSVHVPALQALCELLGSLWPVLLNNAEGLESDKKQWPENVQNLFIAADLEPQLLLNCFERLTMFSLKTFLSKGQNDVENIVQRDFMQKLMQRLFARLRSHVCCHIPLELLVCSKGNPIMDNVCHMPQNLLRISRSVAKLLIGICSQPLTTKQQQQHKNQPEMLNIFPTTAVGRLLQLIGGALAVLKSGSAESEERKGSDEFLSAALDVCGCLCCTPSCPLFLSSMGASTLENIVQMKKARSQRVDGETSVAVVIDMHRIRLAYDSAVRASPNMATSGVPGVDFYAIVKERCPLLIELLSGSDRNPVENTG